MTVRVYVEGGGDHNKDLQTRCRQGFSEFLRKAGLDGRMPKVVVCGGRREAYESFQTSQENSGPHDFAVLLVDSEEGIVATDPWDHVRLRTGDAWQRPLGASNDQLHFMAQTMEAWFYADKNTLESYYRNCFHAASLSHRLDVENIPKVDLYSGLKNATRTCPKGEYSKGEHSFQILGRIDSAKVSASAPHALRFLSVLDRMC